MRVRNSKTAQQNVEEGIILHLLLCPYYELDWHIAENIYFYNDNDFMRAHPVTPYYDNLIDTQWAKPEGVKTHFDKFNEFLDANFLDVILVQHKDTDRSRAARLRWKRLYEIRRTAKFESVNKKILTDFFLDETGAPIDGFKWPERPVDPPEPDTPHIPFLKRGIFGGDYKWGSSNELIIDTSAWKPWAYLDSVQAESRLERTGVAGATGVAGPTDSRRVEYSLSIDYAKIETETLARLKEAESASNQRFLESLEGIQAQIGRGLEPTPLTGRQVSGFERITDEIVKQEDAAAFKILFDTEMTSVPALREDIMITKESIAESFEAVKNAMVTINRNQREYNATTGDGQKMFVIESIPEGALPMYNEVASNPEEKEPELVKEATPEDTT